MHDRLVLAAIGLASYLAAPPILSAGSHKPADLPLRVAIFGAPAMTIPPYGSFQFAEGEGRGDLFENGKPAIDFQYHCPKRFRGFSRLGNLHGALEKPRSMMELLLPEIENRAQQRLPTHGPCARTQAYVALQGGEAAVIPAASFKLWMDKAQYVPENGEESPSSH
jgi:hypothetical protein